MQTFSNKLYPLTHDILSDIFSGVKIKGTLKRCLLRIPFLSKSGKKYTFFSI